MLEHRQYCGIYGLIASIVRQDNHLGCLAFVQRQPAKMEIAILLGSRFHPNGNHRNAFGRAYTIACLKCNPVSGVCSGAL